MPVLCVNNVDLWFEQHGSGWPLVLVHGLGLDGRMWGPCLPALAARYRVTHYDVRGHGRSAAPATGYSRDARVRELLGLLQGLGIERCHLVGHSMGGTLALGFALRHPSRVSSLVLVGSCVAGARPEPPVPSQSLSERARRDGLEAARRAWLDEPLFATCRRLPAAAELLATMVSEHSCALWLDAAADSYPEPDDVERLADLAVPTLVVVGEREVPGFRALAERLHGAIPGAQRVVLEGGGHMAPLEQPERFATLVLDFLARQEIAQQRSRF